MTIEITSKYGTFTHTVDAWRCADKATALASYPQWHEGIDAHEWLSDKPLTTDRVQRVVANWPLQRIATIELDNGFFYQVRYR